MFGHVIVSGHVFGHVTSKVWRDHMICHVVDQVIASQGHVEESSSLLLDYSLA